MKRYISPLFFVVLCLTSALAFGAAVSQSFTWWPISIGQSTESPGPSFTLWNSPYYTCSTNRFVGNFGSGTPSDSNNGTSQSTPWATIAHADTTAVAGQCINVAAGSYNGFNSAIAHGGNTASATGYVVYRCAAPGSDHNLPGNGGGFSGTGCLITDGGKSVCTGSGAGCGTSYPSYLVFDGFSFVSPAFNQNATAVTCYNGDTGTVAPGCHHWVIVNNVITGYGQGGIQMNDSEWEFTLHNIINSNAKAAGCDGGAQGSGISYAASIPLGTYTQTADDIGPTTKLGIYGNTNPNHIHQFIEWNVVSNNHMVGCGSGGSTDGNGIIIDSTDNSATTNYAVNGPGQPNYTLIFGNVVYNNGGQGIKALGSSYVIEANNSVFNNVLDPNFSQSAMEVGNMEQQRGVSYQPGNGIFINNISYSVRGTGGATGHPNAITYLVANFNSNTGTDAFYNNGGSGCPTINGVTDCGGHNLDFLKNFGGTPPGENAINNNNPAWSCSQNKCQADGSSTPFWTNVSGTGGQSGSTGTMDTPPASTNFALPSNSPAQTYALTRSYLPSSITDAGACNHSLTTCP